MPVGHLQALGSYDRDRVFALMNMGIMMSETC